MSGHPIFCVQLWPVMVLWYTNYTNNFAGLPKILPQFWDVYIGFSHTFQSNPDSLRPRYLAAARSREPQRRPDTSMAQRNGYHFSISDNLIRLYCARVKTWLFHDHSSQSMAKHHGCMNPFWWIDDHPTRYNPTFDTHHVVAHMVLSGNDDE